jgi:Na+-translocating ferredoxin:NAD+ oxidoreductase RnfD subunit
MKKFLAWVEGKAIPAVEKWWRPVAIVVGIILAVILGKRIIGGAIDAIFGKVTNGTPFTIITGDPAHVAIQTAKGTQVIALPVDSSGKQVTSDQVTALAYAPGYLAKVEVQGGNTNRR